ncbi:MAG: hypothetical protein R2729_07685 [Bryobacteraceae bacterium]
MSPLRIGRPVTAAGFIIVPIERALLQSWVSGADFGAYGGKEPEAIVIVSGAKQRALAIDGEEIDIGALVSRVPGLDAALCAAVLGEEAPSHSPSVM